MLRYDIQLSLIKNIFHLPNRYLSFEFLLFSTGTVLNTHTISVDFLCIQSKAYYVAITCTLKIRVLASQKRLTSRSTLL